MNIPLDQALKLADQDCPLPSLAGPALKELRRELRDQQHVWSMVLEAVQEVAGEQFSAASGTNLDRVLQVIRCFSASRSAVVPELPLNDAVRSILGKPCFTLIHLANALRRDGHAISHKAEDEQAVCLHWMLNLYLKHGTEWGKVATAEIERMAKKPRRPEDP